MRHADEMCHRFYLGGAQSFLVQSIRVPTYVFPLHVTLTTSTPERIRVIIRMSFVFAIVVVVVVVCEFTSFGLVPDDAFEGDGRPGLTRSEAFGFRHGGGAASANAGIRS